GFNERQPKTKLFPEWTSPLDVSLLVKYPFESFSKTSLKFTTYKLFFLQTSLRFGRYGTPRWEERRGSGISSGEKKKQTHGLKTGFVLVSERKADQYRRCIGKSENRFYIAISWQHRKVLMQTFSKANDDISNKVKTQSTRLLRPSWAVYKGSSMFPVLEAADWPKSTKFVICYLRNIEHPYYYYY
ncbi:hypothetical protein MAR_030638, partial [Mya arenaria]